MKYNPYSISKIGAFEQCPYKFKLQYIDKIKVKKDNFHLLKGSLVHKILEENFNYNIDTKEYNLSETDIKNITQKVKDFEYSDLGQKIKKLIQYSTLEEDFALDKNLTLCDFWDKEVMLRGSADLYYTKDNIGYIFDYKTGKDHSKEKEFGITQGTMYAIYLFIKYPKIKNINAYFVFIEHNTYKKINFKREHFKEYIKVFYNKIKNIETTKHFIEKTSILCEYCDYYKTHCTIYDERNNDDIYKVDFVL